METFGAHDRFMVGRECEYIVVDIIMFMTTTINLHFFVYWGACRPPDPPVFFRHGRRARIQVYSCRYNYVYEYSDQTAFFRILGGVPAPRPPAFFRHGWRVGLRVYTCRYNYLYEYNDRCALIYTGGRAAPQTPLFFSAWSASRNKSI